MPVKPLQRPKPFLERQTWDRKQSGRFGGQQVRGQQRFGGWQRRREIGQTKVLVERNSLGGAFWKA